MDRPWWQDLWVRLFTQFASLASLIGVMIALVPAHTPWPLWAKGWVAFSAICFAAVVFIDSAGRSTQRKYATGDITGIRQYMHEWIRNGGRVAIWSRDLSWATSADTRQLLTSKAKQGELILCLPKMIALADQLKSAGAEVCIYGSHLFDSPASRFTVTFFGRAGSRVAVGRAVGNYHVIDEFTCEKHPAFHLAEDLVAFARATQRCDSHDPSTLR